MAAEKPTYNDDLGLPEIHYNPLQNYRNVTYNTRLTMMPPIEATKSRPDRSYNYKDGIVMWETGGSGSVYLEELNMNSAGTGNNTGAYLSSRPTNFTGRFVEPIGGRFFEALSLAAMQLGYWNNNTQLLFEIYFVGYDTQSDEPVQCKGWQDEAMIFRWYVMINDMKMSLDYKGAIYDFELCIHDGNAAKTDFTNIEQGFRMKGRPATIGDFCTEFAKALNEREEEKVKSGIRCIPHKYVITAHKEIAPLKYDYGLFGDFAAKWGMFKGEIQAQPGTSIQTFITQSMPNSQDVLKFLHQIPKKKEFNSPDTKPDTSHIPMRSFAIIQGNRDILKNGKQAYDDKLGATAQEVHYFVTSREDALNTVSPNEYKDATDPKNRDKRVENWIKKGLLRKVYKWIYTGENIEVINAEIKIDHMWRNVRPLWIDDATGKPVAAQATQSTSKEQPAGKGNPNAMQCNDARNVKPTTGKTYYAEDMLFNDGKDIDKDIDKDISPKEGWYPHMPQFYHMNTSVQQNSQQGSIKEETAQEYSIYRQIANNQAGGENMNSLTLEVVGDPYWLLQIPSKTATTPPWTDDVWEYEKNQLTEEMMAEKRKHASTNTWLSFIYFEAQVPSADNDNKLDLMNLRRSDAISGVYTVREIKNKFVKGKFTTTLSCVRDNLASPWSGKSETTSTTPTKTTGNAASKGPSNAGVDIMGNVTGYD
jgi:hypothetical protein